MKGAYVDAQVLLETDKCIAFRETSPAAKTHFLVVPKPFMLQNKDMRQLTQADGALMGHLMVTVAKVAEQLNLKKGYRTVINNGAAAGQAQDCHDG